MFHTDAQLVTVPFKVLKPHAKHEDWFVTRLSPYQPDKRRFVILDGENETLTIVVGQNDRNKIDISIKLTGCVVQTKSNDGMIEIEITWAELAPVPPTAGYTNMTYDGAKRIIYLIVPTIREADDWYEWIFSAIRNSNIRALQGMSRQPEVMEWYYKLQEQVVATLNEYSSEIPFTWYYSESLLILSTEDQLSNSIIYVMLSSRDQGLSFRLNTTNKHKITRQENLMNGRVIKFKDIIGIEVEALPLPLESQTKNDESNQSSETIISIAKLQSYGEKLRFILKTKEEDIILESSYDINAAKKWLQVLQMIVEFIQIPIPPKSSSISYNNSNSSPSPYTTPTVLNSSTGKSPLSPVATSTLSQVSPMRLTTEFTANSSVIYTSSTDILFILQSLCSLYESQYPILIELKDILMDVWKLLSDVRFNREAINLFGERLESIVRLLGDDNQRGLLSIAGKNFTRLINASLTRFKTKLNEIESYLVPLTTSGWLVHTLLKLSSTSQSMKSKLQYYDQDFTSTFNQLYKSIMKSTSTMSDTSDSNGKGTHQSLYLQSVVYDMASDIKRSIDAFGGVKAIYSDKAKIRALSRLVQCDASDLQNELMIILNDPKQSSLVNQTNNISSYRTLSQESNQNIINFESPPGTFIRKSVYNGRMSEGSYHRFEDASVHYQSIYPVDEHISQSNPHHNNASNSSLLSLFRIYVCCCIFRSNKTNDGSNGSLLSSLSATDTSNSMNNQSPDKFIVKKSTKAKFRNSMLERTMSTPESGATPTSLVELNGKLSNTINRSIHSPNNTGLGRTMSEQGVNLSSHMISYETYNNEDDDDNDQFTTENPMR